MTHKDLGDVDDQTIVDEVGGGWLGLQELAPEIMPNILALPYGSYPDAEKHQAQLDMLRDGFAYGGTEIAFDGVLMA